MNTYRTYFILAIATLAVLFFIFKREELSQKLPVQKISVEKQLKEASKKVEYIQGDVLVKFKETTPERIRLYFKQTLKVKKEEYIQSINVYHWSGDFDTEAAVKLLTKSKHVLYAEPNYTVSTQKP